MVEALLTIHCREDSVVKVEALGIEDCCEDNAERAKLKYWELEIAKKTILGK